MRGDEPLFTSIRDDGYAEFPACAGMNRYATATHSSDIGVPRMRGDEPQY